MDTTFDPQRLSSQNIVVYLMDKLPADSPNSSLPSTGFYQPPACNDPAVDSRLTFKQLFQDLGLIFKWAAYDEHKPRSHPQNAYAAGLVLLSQRPSDTSENLVRVSEPTASDGNNIVNLIDFSDAAVPVGNYTLLRHDERRCLSHVDLLTHPTTARSTTTTITITSSSFSSSSSSSFSCSSPPSCLALNEFSGFRSPRAPGPVCCISNVSLDLNLLHRICLPDRPSMAASPLGSPRKRKRPNIAKLNSTMSAPMTIEHIHAYIESPSLDRPIGKAGINPGHAASGDLTQRTMLFRAEVTKRDQCCRLTGQKTPCGAGGLAIDVCHIVPLSKPDEWSDDLRLAVWSGRDSPTLQLRELDVNVPENGICLRRDLRYLFGAYLWSVHPDTFKVRVFVNLDSLLPFHGQDIRLHLPRFHLGLQSINDGPPADVWRWHYQQCILRMLRASINASPLLRSLGESGARMAVIRSERTRPRMDGPTVAGDTLSRPLSLISPSLSLSPSRDTPMSRHIVSGSRVYGLTEEQTKLWM